MSNHSVPGETCRIEKKLWKAIQKLKYAQADKEAKKVEKKGGKKAELAIEKTSNVGRKKAKAVDDNQQSSQMSTHNINMQQSDVNSNNFYDGSHRQVISIAIV